MENYVKLKELVASIEADADKFFNNGNSAAGTRVRKGLQEIKTLAQELRNEVTAKKNDGTTSNRHACGLRAAKGGSVQACG
jgi:hypothetical protein